MSKRETQSDRILKLLQDRYPSSVPLPSILCLCIAQYNARIFELRRRGHNIICEKETVDGQVRSKYRLVRP